MEPRISLITLGVSNLERSLRFYRDGLGWSVSGASVAGVVAFLHTKGTVLALYPRHDLAADANLPDGGPGFGGIALAHNVRTREEVDSVIAEAVRAGATLLKRAQTADWGGYTGYFADPDGYPWEVAFNPGFPLGPDGSIQLPQ